jgi:hypothetical protein
LANPANGFNGRDEASSRAEAELSVYRSLHSGIPNEFGRINKKSTPSNTFKESGETDRFGRVAPNEMMQGNTRKLIGGNMAERVRIISGLNNRDD